MQSFFYSAAFAAVGSAALLRRDQCCFQITASGGVSGVMGQLDDGQNRLNGTYPAATYCYSNGGITDASGRGCIVTTTNDATHQFQCDEGTAAQAGFSISANGSLAFDSSDQFYACPYNNGNIIEYNVYTQELAGQDKCVAVKLSTGGKCATSGSTCSMATTTIYATAPAASSPAAYTSVQSIPEYSSAAMTPASSIPVAASSVMAYTSSMEVPAVPESSVPAVSIPVYATSSAVVSSFIAVPTSSTASEVVYSSTASVATMPVVTAPIATTPIAYTSAASVPAYSSESQATVPSYSAPVVESTAVESSYSVVTSTWMASSSAIGSVPAYSPMESTSIQSSSAVPISSATPSSSVVSIPAYSAASSTWIASSSAIISVPAYSATPSSYIATSTDVVSVPAYNATSKIVSSTWTTIATSTSIAATTSSVAVASSYSEASTTVATSTSASVCQTALTGAYQTPHLIVPVSSSSPDTAYGTQYDAYIDSDNSTIFNFDIPSSYEGMTCTTIFLFPEIADLETSSYTFSGSGDVVFSQLSSVATEETTYNNSPSVSSVLDTIAIASGNSYVVASGSCAAGTTISIEASSENGLSLVFFEDWNPSSLGLYVTAC